MAVGGVIQCDGGGGGTNTTDAKITPMLNRFTIRWGGGSFSYSVGVLVSCGDEIGPEF